MSNKRFFARAYEIIKKVPVGKVVTYGQVATMMGNPRAARTIGWAMHALSDPHSGVPWHRVVNAKGTISACTERYENLQRQLLKAEGIEFDRGGKIDLLKYGWRPQRVRKGP